MASCNPMSKVLFLPEYFNSYFPSFKSTKTSAPLNLSPLCFFKTPLMVYKSLARPWITLSKLKPNRFLMLLSKWNQIRALIHICLDRGEKLARVTCSETRDKMSMSLSLFLSFSQRNASVPNTSSVSCDFIHAQAYLSMPQHASVGLQYS